MNINVHAHLFTLRSVLSREAIRVMTQRLTDRGFPDFLVEAIRKLFEDLIDRPRNLDERELLGGLVAKLMTTTGFNDFLNTELPGHPLALTLKLGGVEKLPVDVLRQVIDKLTTSQDTADKVGKSVFDIIEALRLAMRSTITDVADALLETMAPDDALVALMMDIHGPDEPDRDRANFQSQIAGTEEAALQRPGRVFPFFAVHPERTDHLALLKQAIEQRGFAGVKLYPSLGYKVGSPELMRVYQYCLEKDTPVLLHCGHGGFYRKDEYIDYCNPDHWIPVLDQLPELRVCFAHFGGWQSLGRPDGLDPGTWGATIRRLMREKPNVYTDLAYHTDQMSDRANEEHYFRKLAELLADVKLQKRILFGTDSWLLRLDMSDVVYWRYFRERMKVGDFAKIASAAPRSFLGFPDAAGQPLRANLQRYVDHMAANRSKVGALPAPWLKELIAQPFTVARAAADWSDRRWAVRLTYQGLGELMTSAQKHKGYRVNRTLKLRELLYWRPNDANFEQICLDQARKLMTFARQKPDGTGKFGYRGTYDDTSAVDRLVELFKDGNKRLVDVALLLDTVIDLEESIA